MEVITVMECFYEMGVVPDKHLSWKVGRQVRDTYVQQCNKFPDKELRTKTRGGGSHCFAVYPLEFKDQIKAIITENCEVPPALEGI